MKTKLYISLLLLVFNSGFAQVPVTRWLNYAQSLSKYKNKAPYITRHVLFPDSTVRALNDNSQLFRSMGSTFVYFHQFSSVLDPYSPVFNTVDKIFLDPAKPYKVDSIGIDYTYVRNISDPAIVDTLYVYTYTNNNTANLPLYFTTGWKSIHGVDTVYSFFPRYDFGTQRTLASDLTLNKVLLKSTDSGTKSKFFPVTEVAVNSGSYIACAIAFKPGYSYSFGDTITATKNYFSFRSCETNGMNTWPTYIPGDRNVSGILTEAEKYNTPNAFNYMGNLLELTTYIWGAAMWEFEHHFIRFRVSGFASPLGVERLEDKHLTMLYNYPNPASGQTTIEYSLTASSEVILEVTDITGRNLVRLNEGFKIPGTYSVKLNTSALPEGIVFYTLRTSGGSSTRKMVVGKD